MNDSLLHTVIAEIPIEYRDRFLFVLGQPPIASTVAHTRLDDYVSMVEKIASWVTALDPQIAQRIATSCHALVDRFDGGDPQQLALATVTYFVEEEEDDEITGVLGFDDDIQVVNAVCRGLGAEDLLVPLVR